MPYVEVQLTRKLQRVYAVQQDTLIGRAPQCPVQLLSRAVSRRHARIEFDGEQAIVSDLGTKNGVKLNGKRVDGAARVADGDVLVVGDIRMVFRAGDRSIAAADVVDLRSRAAGPQDLQAALAGRRTFQLPAHPEALAQFQATVVRGRLARVAELDDEARFKLQLALREAVENARRHGCGGDPTRSLYVTLGEDADELVVSVVDDGPGFDVDRVLGGVQEVDALAAIRDRERLGSPLGLRIILNCVDRLQFGARGSAIHMGKFKAASQLFVISEDLVPGSDVVEELSSDEGPSPFD